MKNVVSNPEEDLGGFLISLVENIREELTGLDEEYVSQKGSPDQWSRKEILGHLIDSACNNHRRFVLFSNQQHLHFDGYHQEDWVNAQNYDDANWIDLVDLWYAYNVHIGRVIRQMPKSKLKEETLDHNFDKIAFRRVSHGQPSSMQYFIKDYILHLQHHIDQINDEAR